MSVSDVVVTAAQALKDFVFSSFVQTVMQTGAGAYRTVQDIMNMNTRMLS
jgi:hypothetical protein